jgi:riboflavin kinase/FMN adenylyltransferase
MEFIDGIENFPNNGLVLTIGFFDGVHLGHSYLAEQLRLIADQEGLKAAFLTFWPHPRIVLDEPYKPKLLNSIDEKKELISKLPIDYCIQMDFSLGISNLLAYDFMKNILKEKLNVKHLLIGYDHRFGKNREEGFDDYCQYGEELGIKVSQAEPFTKDNFTISSSFIRNLLNVGDIKLANLYLNYTYKVTGKVVRGNQLGNKLGFPTGNIELVEKNKCLPQTGVYAVNAIVRGKKYNAMAYLGTRPSISRDNEEILLEVNIFDFNDDIYGEEMTVEFLKKTRAQKRFEDMDALKKAIALDEIEVKNFFTQK